MKKILVIEDDSELIEIVQSYLAEHFQVMTAMDGQEAIQKYHELKPDLLITDLSMPKMDGFELIRLLRASGSDIPIIAISGHPHATVVLNSAREMGANEALQKPFSREEILTLIHSLINNKS